MALIGGGADGAAAFGRDAEPVARLELDHFAVNVEFAPAFEDAVDLLVLHVPVHERNGRACGKRVHGDLAAREAEGVVELRARSGFERNPAEFRSDDCPLLKYSFVVEPYVSVKKTARMDPSPV